MPSTATPLVVGTFSPSVLLRVARATGRFAVSNLEVAEPPVPSSPAPFRARADGSMQAALTSPDNVIAYRFLRHNPLGGPRDVRIVKAVDRGLGLGLYAGTSIRSLDDLRGTVVGVDVAASGFAIALFEILAGAGLDAGADYQVAELGSTPQRLEALLEGRCSATMLNATSAVRADDAGLSLLAPVTAVATPYLGTVLAVQGPPSPEVRALADVLTETGSAIVAGAARDAALVEAEAVGLPGHLAKRYVDLMADPEHGLVPGGAVETIALEALVALRTSRLGSGDPDRAALAAATDPAHGLVDDRP